MRIPKAKPCPFCKSADGYVQMMDYSTHRYWCNNCAALGPPVQRSDYDGAGCQRAERDAIQIWNVRNRKAGRP